MEKSKIIVANSVIIIFAVLISTSILHADSPISDDFSSDQLNTALWTFVDQLGDSTVIANGAQLCFSVPGGLAHTIWTDGILAPHVMQPISDTDFEIEVKFDSELFKRYQIQGLLVQQDPNNFIRMDVFSDGSGVWIFAAGFDNGSPTVYFNSPIAAGSPYYLRLKRQGDLWTSFYSADGQNWQLTGQYSFALTVTAAGIFIGNEPGGTSAPAFTGIVDYFFNTASPIVPEDAGLYTMTVCPDGDGMVLKNPDKVLYADGETVELTAVAGQGWNFTDWSGDISGSENPVSLIMNGDGNVNVNFIKVQSTAVLDVWYGLMQDFGHIGNPQVWVDILGNVSDPAGEVTLLEYSLNNGAFLPLSVGPDGLRLHNEGDFCVEIAYADLLDGDNQLLLKAVDDQNFVTEQTVIINYTSGNEWPRNYSIDWSTVAEIQDAVQVVDGLWIIDTNGLRTADVGYARSVVIGDILWDDYEVTVPITVHSFDPAAFQSSSRHPGVGFFLRWTGHTDEPVYCGQPHCGWQPHGSSVWYKWDANGGFADDTGGSIKYSGLDPLEFDVCYNIKMRVETIADQNNLYSLKIWRDGQSEPELWQKSGLRSPDVNNGSLILFADYVDATFGDIEIVRLSVPQNRDYYLDPNGNDGGLGTVDDPWQSVAYAEAHAESGSTIYLRDGNYGNVVIDRLSCGRTSWAEAITLKPQPGHNPVIRTIEIGQGWQAAPLIDRYIVFDGLKISCPSGVDGSPQMVNIYQGGCIKLLNCEISGSVGQIGDVYYKSGATGVAVQAGRYDYAGIRDITVENCHIYNSSRGITLEGDFYGEIKLIGNTIHDLGGSAVRLSKGDGGGFTTYIEGNLIYRQLHMWNVDQTEYVHGSGLSIRKSNVTARDNIIHGYAASSAITTYTGVYPEYGYQNMRFENNLIYDSRSPYYCVRFFDVGNNFIFNNNTITGTHNPDRGGVHYYENALSLEGYATYVDLSTIQLCNNIIVGYNNWGLAVAADQGAKVRDNLFYSYCGDGGLWRDQSWMDANLPGNRVYCWNANTPDDFGLVGVPGSVFKGGYLFDYWAYYRIPGTRAQGTEHNVDLGDSFSLASESCARDFADANYAPATDICGNLRDGYPDAGAYEYACLYVSADSPNNPGTGTLADPYRQIQYAIDAANRGYNIFVTCGIYNESITIENGIYLHGGYLPDNWDIPNNPDANASVIDANSLNDSAVHIIGADATITGFTIMGGSAENGGGIYCQRSKAVIGNCTITSNQASGYGGGIYCEAAEPIIYNCRIAANQAGDAGGGIYNSDGPIVNCTVADNIAGNYGGGLFDCNEPVTNCIVWGNSDSTGMGQLAQIDSYYSNKVNYNCIQGWSGNSDGTGNIGVDPLFVDAANRDYHLQSLKGRWDGNGEGGWVTDSLTSPCVDAGNPGQPLGDEPADADNIRINMGSYGGTAKASMTPAGWAITADMTNDGYVSFADLEYWSQKWLNSADNWFGDLDSSRQVDMADFAIFAECWLAETSWYEP